MYELSLEMGTYGHGRQGEYDIAQISHREIINTYNYYAEFKLNSSMVRVNLIVP